LPTAIGALSDLRHLDLRGNPLVELPVSIADLPALARLDMRWTPRLVVPPWLEILRARGVLVYR